MAEEGLGQGSEALVPLLEEIAGLLWSVDRHDEARTFFNRSIDLSVWNQIDPLAAAN